MIKQHQLLGQQYGVRHRKVTYWVKTGRYTTALKGYRAWRMRTG